MGGGKETPRQKMIGMMYLVLTALLAMNVSASILQKFAFLDGSLHSAMELTVKRNEGKISDIDASVKERGEKPKEVKILKEAHEVREETEKVITYIEGLKEAMITQSGGPAEGGGMIPGAKNRDVVMTMMLGGAKNGKAYELKKKLNGFVDFINQHAPEARKHKYFALDGKEDPLAKDDPEQNGKDFAELNFEETPTIAALAVLSQLQSKVSTYESEVLAELGGLVGASDFKFDIVSFGSKPTSQVVAAGTKYESEIFISATSSTIKPKMRWKHYGGKEFTALDSSKIIGGVGVMDFRATGGAYDKDGNAKKKWIGELEFKGPEGMVVFSDTVEYTVSKPVIQIQSASVSALYLNCGNKLNVQVPALGEEYKPSFGVTGGTRIVGKDKGFVTIVPSSPKVVLSVSSGGALIGKQNFKVRKIPLPTIQILSNGRKINMKTGFKSCPRSLQFKAIPDASFKEFLPDDARYQVVAGTVELARGKRIVKKAKIKGGKANMSALKGAARDGDRIIVEIKKVNRKNFQKKSETVRGLGALIYQLPINS